MKKILIVLALLSIVVLSGCNLSIIDRYCRDIGYEEGIYEGIFKMSFHCEIIEKSGVISTSDFYKIKECYSNSCCDIKNITLCEPEPELSGV